jgi:hypothetical protein
MHRFIFLLFLILIGVAKYQKDLIQVVGIGFVGVVYFLYELNEKEKAKRRSP